MAPGEALLHFSVLINFFWTQLHEPFYFLAALSSLHNLNSPTKDRTVSPKVEA